ncbi:hypothetical protein DLAC_10172 [Tieghemostelium lacteum]|uniref:Uncharacterized protein n=1 Tax=Tieghemostelium lacteum TaxID=361077 RepID=A0A151Z6A5_TIELA|nr:hypothetical protein DLAC_10172 [Tieghemostelium lacteum]|eukprot:KYQ89496.1 hypothetical protein DLAC_10172 [Tieghemostelium lacteum]
MSNDYNNNNQINTDDKDDFVLVNDGMTQSVWVDINGTSTQNQVPSKSQLPIYQITQDVPIYENTKEQEGELIEEEMTEEEEQQVLSQILSKSVSETKQINIIEEVKPTEKLEVTSKKEEQEVPDWLKGKESSPYISRGTTENSYISSSPVNVQYTTGRISTAPLYSTYNNNTSYTSSPSSTSSFTSVSKDSKPYVSSSKSPQSYSYAY